MCVFIEARILFTIELYLRSFKNRGNGLFGELFVSSAGKVLEDVEGLQGHSQPFRPAEVA